MRGRNRLFETSLNIDAKSWNMWVLFLTTERGSFLLCSIQSQLESVYVCYNNRNLIHSSCLARLFSLLSSFCVRNYVVLWIDSLSLFPFFCVYFLESELIDSAHISLFWLFWSNGSDVFTRIHNTLFTQSTAISVLVVTYNDHIPQSISCGISPSSKLCY
jgi:hypothetical protein